MTPKLTDDEKSDLLRLMAIATTAGEYFDQESLDILILVGKGLFLDPEFTDAASNLAGEVQKEMNYWSNQ